MLSCVADNISTAALISNSFISLVGQGLCGHCPLLISAHSLLIYFPDYLSPNASHDMAAYLLWPLGAGRGPCLLECECFQGCGIQCQGWILWRQLLRVFCWHLASPLPPSQPQRKHCKLKPRHNGALGNLGAQGEWGCHLVAESKPHLWVQIWMGIIPANIRYYSESCDAHWILITLLCRGYRYQ